MALLTLSIVQRGNRDPFFRFSIKTLLPSGKYEELRGHLHEVFFLQLLIVIFGALAAIVDKDDFYLLDHALLGVIQTFILLRLVGGLFGLLVHRFYLI